MFTADSDQFNHNLVAMRDSEFLADRNRYQQKLVERESGLKKCIKKVVNVVLLSPSFSRRASAKN